MNRRFTLLVLLFPLAALAQPIPCENGFAGAYPCRNVDLLAQPTDRGATDLWGWTDPLTGTEYAIIFIGGDATFFDLSDPSAPVEVGVLDGGQDARVYADHLFIVADSGLPGMVVFDLRRLRDVENPPVAFDADAVYTGITRAHNLSLDTASGFAYPVSVRSSVCSGSLHIVDVRDPVSPTFAGCFEGETLGSFHDAHCFTYDGPDADYAGRELCIGSAPLASTIAVVDVTDKAEPVLIAEAPYPNPAYAHQGWLTEDGRYFLLNDEFDEPQFSIRTRTIVFDVEDLDNPEFAFEHFAETTSNDHNLFVKGGYVYQANYFDGFRLLDLAQIDSGTLSEVAFFDTTPGDEDYFGAWGVYPFFESGVVIVSDELRGLFVLQPRLEPATATEPVPENTVALDAYPNPFAERATVALTLGAAQQVTVAVYDVLGREVAVLHDGPLTVGDHRFTLGAVSLPTGAYLVRAEGEGFRAARRVSVVR